MSRNTSYQRNERLSELIREIIAETLRALDNSTLEFVAVTKVIVDNNLNHAQILITTLQENNLEKKILRELQKNKPAFMKALSTQTRFKQLPELTFEIDEGLKTSRTIEGILKDLDLEDV